MKDMTKASNPFYLAFFLFAVCGISTVIMAFTAVLTEEPIRISQAKETANSLRMILPEFDNDPSSCTQTLTAEDGSTVKLYIAERDNHIVGYVAESSGSGFGGMVTGLVSFAPDGAVSTVIIKSGHSETPGIGTKVTDRITKRTISDLIRGIKPDPNVLPPNPVLDSYTGKKAGDAKWTNADVTFISGATFSSRAVCDLVWNAATAVQSFIRSNPTTREEK